LQAACLQDHPLGRFLSRLAEIPGDLARKAIELSHHFIEADHLDFDHVIRHGYTNCDIIHSGFVNHAN